MNKKATRLIMTESNYAYANAMYKHTKDPKHRNLKDNLEVALLEAGYDEIDMDLLEDRSNILLKTIKNRQT